MGTPRLKITLIGAGSTVFTRNLLGDILSYPELAGCEIALHDIDAHRLELSRKVALRIAERVETRGDHRGREPDESAGDESADRAEEAEGPA